MDFAIGSRKNRPLRSAYKPLANTGQGKKTPENSVRRTVSDFLTVSFGSRHWRGTGSNGGWRSRAAGHCLARFRPRMQIAW